MKKIVLTLKAPKARNPVATALHSGRFTPKTIPDPRIYNRKKLRKVEILSD